MLVVSTKPRKPVKDIRGSALCSLPLAFGKPHVRNSFLPRIQVSLAFSKTKLRAKQHGVQVTASSFVDTSNFLFTVAIKWVC